MFTFLKKFFKKPIFLSDEEKRDILNEFLYDNISLDEIGYLYLIGKTNGYPDENYRFLNHFRRMAEIKGLDIDVIRKSVYGSHFSMLREISIEIKAGKCIINEKWGLA